MSSSLVWLPDSPDAGDAFEPSGSSEDLETDCSEAGRALAWQLGLGTGDGVGTKSWNNVGKNTWKNLEHTHTHIYIYICVCPCNTTEKLMTSTKHGLQYML